MRHLLTLVSYCSKRLTIVSFTNFSGVQSFYQFLRSNRGAALTDILSLGGQPTPSMWDHFEKKWLQGREAWNDQV